MKGYGLPRNDDVAHPDIADIRHYGLKTSASGTKRGIFKSKTSKAARRRIWKKKARRYNKSLTQTD